MNTQTETADAIAMRAGVMGLGRDGLSTPAKIKKQRAKRRAACTAAERNRKAVFAELAELCERLDMHGAAKELAAAAERDWLTPRLDDGYTQRNCAGHVAIREGDMRTMKKNGAARGVTAAILRLEEAVFESKVFDEWVPPGAER